MRQEMKRVVFIFTGAILGLTALHAGNVALSDDGSAAASVKLERLNWKQLQERLVNKNAKITMIDAWSTTCGPCKENFPTSSRCIINTQAKAWP